jgi:hypothetical protein
MISRTSQSWPDGVAIEVNQPPPFRFVKVKRVREACGAYCTHCGEVFDELQPFWHWRKSQYMHERGTGHKMVMFKIEYREAQHANQ